MWKKTLNAKANGKRSEPTGSKESQYAKSIKVINSNKNVRRAKQLYDSLDRMHLLTLKIKTFRPFGLIS